MRVGLLEGPRVFRTTRGRRRGTQKYDHTILSSFKPHTRLGFFTRLATRLRAWLSLLDITSVSLVLVANMPILTHDLSTRLKPLQLTVATVSHLPGIAASNKNVLPYVTPSPFTLLNTLCEPTYCLLRWYSEADTVPSASPRLIRTYGKPCVRR